jgi:CubicO group peptidase (beta-lactamase class C family)/D-alanyl-D-alanine dipeptidase
MPRHFVLTAIFLLLPASLFAQPQIAPPDKYAPVAANLEKLIQHEVVQKKLPAISIALVDDQTVVWAKGFGYADPAAKKPATAETVYRVGSVSKLFTDIAVMQLVEAGKLDLDAPVTNYIPEFKPKDLKGKPITLRHMMAHRAGLVREPPVGHYFDAVNLSLEKMVASLNDTPQLFPVETKIKYSNAAIATVGYVLQRTQKEEFAKYLQHAVLDPLGMKHSNFGPTPESQKELAKAIMWTYQGREFPAPTFELGEAPAGCMYTTVLDLGKFISVLAAKGQGPSGRMVKPETIEQMFTPQFAKPEDKSGFGIGFMIGELQEKKRIGHGGAIYGFATELAYLPDEKLGAVVVISCDCANPIATRIANEALGQMLAIKKGKELPKIEQSEPLSPDDVRQLAGRWKDEKTSRFIDLTAYQGKIYAIPSRGGSRVEIRKADKGFIVDDRFGYGTKLELKDGKLVIGDMAYQHVDVPKPSPPPHKWLGLIGEYGEDHNILYIHERDGKLWALIEWFYLYPLTEESENVYAFPDFGLYHDEKIIFERDKTGRATRATAANCIFNRRTILGENGETFKIQPIRQMDGLRKEALAAEPPHEPGQFRKPELVDLTTLDPALKLDIRYATSNNFCGTPFYTSAKAFMQKPAAEALVRVNKKLEADGFGLLIHDAYRPWFVTKMFWEATPEKFHIFVADPLKGSRHNRGCAVDLTLYDRKTGEPILMTGVYDEMSDRSWPMYSGGTSSQRWHRDLLRKAMELEGFAVYEAEWWHFDYKDWKEYPILNLTFEQLAGRK